MESVEKQAREANSPENWDKLWKEEGLESWRGDVLEAVYDRIVQLIPNGSFVLDIGGGVGILAKRLQEEKKCDVVVWDISAEACAIARANGVEAHEVDLELLGDHAHAFDMYQYPNKPTYIVCTECAEHLSSTARYQLFQQVKDYGFKAFISVPNDRLGPDEEPQHTIKYTAIEYKNELKSYFEHSRVEVLGPNANRHNQPAFLLGVIGFPKITKMSVCFPARDEAADIEKTLASFRGVADDLVVGVDPRTKDNTWEICEKYCDKIFFLETPHEEPGGKTMNDKGVHFAWIRNQCIDQSEGPWIFMTEAHEPLSAGQDVLLHLDRLPEAAKIVAVTRRGGPPAKRQRWAFPWLIRKDPKIRYQRATHNTVDYPDSYMMVALPQIETLHERVHERDLARKEQRKIQNRIDLMEDWLTHKNENSLFYLGSEWREYDEEMRRAGRESGRAIRYLKEYITVNRSNGALRYHTRLIAAKLLWQKGEIQEAKEILHAGTFDDWSRIEHWMYLGDIATTEEKEQEALQYYLYAATKINNPPWTTWWIDEAFYSYLPAQRLASTYAALGLLNQALTWAQKAKDLLPEETPLEAVEEATSIIERIQEKIDEPQNA